MRIVYCLLQDRNGRQHLKVYSKNLWPCMILCVFIHFYFRARFHILLHAFSKMINMSKILYIIWRVHVFPKVEGICAAHGYFLAIKYVAAIFKALENDFLLAYKFCKMIVLNKFCNALILNRKQLK